MPGMWAYLAGGEGRVTRRGRGGRLRFPSCGLVVRYTAGWRAAAVLVVAAHREAEHGTTFLLADPGPALEVCPAKVRRQGAELFVGGPEDEGLPVARWAELSAKASR